MQNRILLALLIKGMAIFHLGQIISTEFGLNTFTRGKRKLFRSFYRFSRLLALKKERKGRRLDENANVLSMIAQKVKGVGH